MFLSIRKKIKPFEKEKTTQDPEVREAAEAALLCITAHARLPRDFRRQNWLKKHLIEWGFSFAANALERHQRPEASLEFRLRRREWSNIEKKIPWNASLQTASSEVLGQLALQYADSLSGAAGVWALELARRGQTGGLDCPAWMKIARSTWATHSERRLMALWPVLRQVCRPEELASPIETKDAPPEWVRLYESDASFSERIRLCLTVGIRFDARLLREAFLQQSRPNLSGLAEGFLCSGEAFLDFRPDSPGMEALRLHFSGKTQEALQHLGERRPENDFAGRMEAARLALHFGDAEAADGHLAWAAALAQDPLARADALARLAVIRKMKGEETWTLLQERFRLDPRRTARALWLSGQWPALILLSGKAPLPWRDEAAAALQHFVDCNPRETPDSGNPLIAEWRRQIGLEQLRRLWPSAAASARPCPAQFPPSAAFLQKKPEVWTWRGDFASDLALLLTRDFPPEAWEAFHARHVHDPRLITAAELEILLYPDSFGHARAAAMAFAWKNEPQRAITLLEDAALEEPEPADAWKKAAFTLLEAGYRHEAAMFMQLRHEWQTAFVEPAETGRSDWRLDAGSEAVDFLWKAGFPAEARSRLETLLGDARRADPLRGARAAERLARQHPGWFTTASLLRFTDNPLFFLEWAVLRPDARREAAYILAALFAVLPDAPEIPWLSCALLENESECIKADIRGIDGEIRLEMALDMLDHLQGFSTRARRADERLALHAAWRRSRQHPAWQFVFIELMAQPQ